MGRIWDDSGKEAFKEGRFTKEEESILKDTLETYRQQNELSDNDFYEWLIKPKNTTRNGFWPQIAESLPNRSVRSIKNFCQRKFNPNNYKGKWTHDEELELKGYIKSIGYHWSKIGALMGRTEHNVRDKWKELDNRPKKSNKVVWTLQRTLKLIHLVEQQLDTKILKDTETIIQKYVDEVNNLTTTKKRRSGKSIEQLAIKNVIHNHLTANVEKIANLNITNWKDIAQKLRYPLSINECRNKWFLLFKYQVKHEKMSKRKLITKVIERLIELARVDNNKHDLEYYKAHREFSELASVIDFLIQNRDKHVDLISFLKHMKNYLNNEPIYKLTRK